MLNTRNQVLRRLIVTLLLLPWLAACQRTAGQAADSAVPAARPTAQAATAQATPAGGGDLSSPVPGAAATEGAGPEGLAALWNEWGTYAVALRPASDIAAAGLQPVAEALQSMNQYHLELALSASLNRLDGHAAIRYTNRTTDALDSLYLHLFPNLWGDGMTVAGVQVDGEAAEFALEVDGSILHVSLPRLLQPGQALELALDFSDPIPAGKDVGNYGEFALKDNLLALAGFYPTVAVYDEKGWHTEKPSLQGDVLYADVSLYDVTLTAPANLTVVATGQTLERKDHGDGSATWRLVGGPMRDFNIVVSADFQKGSQQVGGVTVNSYALSADATGRGEALNWASSALKVYQQAFGPYPYRELDVVETPTTAGGIEYPGMVVVAERLYQDPQRRPSFEGATVHEVAHQWWYGVVGDDQLTNPWLDEALAQYSTYLYMEDHYGQATASAYAKADFQGRWDRVQDAAVPIGLPVTAYTDTQYSAIVYGRGPLFLLTLQDQIGKDKMVEFLQRYYRTYAWRIATPADFQALVEQVAQKDFGALFDQWVYPPK